jgi:polysaccharide pyruvyl transferase WcaK-like protein
MTSLAARFQPRWLAQEVRVLAGSECSLHPQLDARVRGSVPLVVPDYATAASTQELLAAWGVPEFMLTSRYHAALIGAWMGSRVVVFPRSEKVRSAMTELRLAGIADMTDTAAAAASAVAAEPVSRALLQEHAALAQRCCDEAWQSLLAMPE